ncbi:MULTISPECIES: hypothetical protein [unclassified Neisseria]|nr:MULTISPECIES: hypothetical protein [unclassified Neisseria]MDO1508870.1 hypothetical protein [Neisseria sp. MVDL19-042950]MDO1515129.1 hypothetical protein [Neisseria sp. MVDL18-041461]MDO1562489.1 hypothetical protein [Neisseria sp. MVDL20-010259]
MPVIEAVCLIGTAGLKPAVFLREGMAVFSDGLIINVKVTVSGRLKNV